MSAVHWLCVSYAGFALATFGWIGVLTYQDEYDAPTWVARIACAVLWPLYWVAVTGCWIYDRTCAVCTAVACRVMHEARQVETQQER